MSRSHTPRPTRRSDRHSSDMGVSPTRNRAARRAGVVVVVLLLSAVLAFALSGPNLDRVWHALVSASPGWLIAALVLMMLSLLARSVSWYEVLRAALPTTRLARWTVLRALTIGVMASAVLPGRIGEPTRI